MQAQWFLRQKKEKNTCEMSLSMRSNCSTFWLKKTEWLLLEHKLKLKHQLEVVSFRSWIDFPLIEYIKIYIIQTYYVLRKLVVE